MADLRLIALLAVAACTDAGAQSAAPPAVTPVAPPAGWTAQPAIAAAVQDALGKTSVDGLAAFGEPAMGCYGAWMALRARGDASELAEQIVRGLSGGAARTLAIRDLVKPTAATGVLALGFDSPPYTGRLRARLGDGKLAALACWWSPREPIACEQACTTLLGGLP